MEDLKPTQPVEPMPLPEPPPPVPQDKPEDQSVKASDHKRLRDDLLKEKQLRKQYEEQIKQSEMNALRKNQEWQKIAELKEQEAMEARQSEARLKESFVQSHKLAAIKEAALKAGARQDALDIFESFASDDVQVEYTSTGRINILGAEDFVTKMKMVKPFLFDSKSARVNPGSPEIERREITEDDVIKAGDKARKTGDYSQYNKVLQLYKKSVGQ